MMNNIYFFIGTEAELIKIFPVIIEAQKAGVCCNIIASGQNDITVSRIFENIKIDGKFLELSKESDIKKTAIGLFRWFISTYLKSKRMIIDEMDENELVGRPLVVHGDTVSTYMGAMIGRKLRMKVCHVEAGLRSHNIFNPFPEEIDRLLTSKIARIHFAPSDEATQNLNKAKGEVINTGANTLIDSLKYSRTIPLIDSKVKKIVGGEEFFVFVMHRQENLADSKFVRMVFEEIVNASKNRRSVIILHAITKNTLMNLGLLDELDNNQNIVLLPRVDYFDFMKLLDASQFVITDGGSNQEELFYMNKPCLIMRRTTERSEGLGINARLFNGKPSDIGYFIQSTNCMPESRITNEVSPSRIIVDKLLAI